MKNIRPKNLESKTKYIVRQTSEEQKYESDIKFSYKYLRLDDPDFSIHSKDVRYFTCVLERLKALCTMPCKEIKANQNRALRNHFINWNDVGKPSFGIPNENQIVDRPFQFSITSNEHGRVIGFFIGSIFFVVWFDPDHNLYS